ncbi:uncharacterized [Tachysurus ichikawai]
MSSGIAKMYLSRHRKRLAWEIRLLAAARRVEQSQSEKCWNGEEKDGPRKNNCKMRVGTFLFVFRGWSYG